MLGASVTGRTLWYGAWEHRGLGAERILLDTRLDLVEARALYVEHGFVEVPPYSDGPYAEAWYGKELGG